MTETQPAESQDQINEIVEKRLARARAKWREEQEARDRQWYRRLVERDARHMLSQMGVTDPSRQSRILRFVDLDQVQELENGDPDLHAIDTQFNEIRADIPELFPSDVGERALDTSTREDVSGLTLETVQKMSPDEVNARWDEVQTFLSGQEPTSVVAGADASVDATTRQVGQ